MLKLCCFCFCVIKVFCPFAEVKSAQHSDVNVKRPLTLVIISTKTSPKMLRLRKNKILPQQVSDLGAFIFVVTMIPITYIWEVMNQTNFTSRKMLRPMTTLV